MFRVEQPTRLRGRSLHQTVPHGSETETRRAQDPAEAEEATRGKPWQVEVAGRDQFRPGSTMEEEPAAATGAAAPQCDE